MKRRRRAKPFARLLCGSQWRNQIEAQAVGGKGQFAGAAQLWRAA